MVSGARIQPEHVSNHRPVSLVVDTSDGEKVIRGTVSGVTKGVGTSRTRYFEVSGTDGNVYEVQIQAKKNIEVWQTDYTRNYVGELQGVYVE
jgi:hypothetical protein